MESFKAAADKALSSLFKSSSALTPINLAIKKAVAESNARLAAEAAAEAAARALPRRQRAARNKRMSEQRQLERGREMRAVVQAYKKTGRLVEERRDEKEEDVRALVGKAKVAAGMLVQGMRESGEEVGEELKAAIEGIERLDGNKEMLEEEGMEEEVARIIGRFQEAIQNTNSRLVTGRSTEEVEKAMEKMEEAGVLDELMGLPEEELEKRLEQMGLQAHETTGTTGGGMPGMFGGKSQEKRNFDPNAEPTVIYEDQIIQPSEDVQKLLEQFEKDLLEDYRMLKKEEDEVSKQIMSMLTDDLSDLRVDKFAASKLSKILATKPNLDITTTEALALHNLASSLFFSIYSREKHPKEVFVRFRKVIGMKESNLKYISLKGWEYLWEVAGAEARLNEKGKFDPHKPIVPTPRQTQLGDYMRSNNVEMNFDQFSKYIISLVWGKERKDEAVEIWQERMDKDRKDPKMWSLGIRMFSMMGNPVLAEETLRTEEATLGVKTPSHFVPVIAFYNLIGQPEEGWRLYEEMKHWERKTKDKVDVLKYAVVAESFLVANEFDRGLRAFKDMLKARAQTPEEVEYLDRFQSLVRLAQATARTPRQLNALSDCVADQLPPAIQDISFYSAWIRGLAKNRRWDLAMNLLKRRAKIFEEPVHPDDLDALVMCFLKCGKQVEAHKMVTEMIRTRLEYLNSDAIIDLPFCYTPEERAQLSFPFPSASRGTFSIIFNHLKNYGAHHDILRYNAALRACSYTLDTHILNHLLTCDLRLSKDPANTFLSLFTTYIPAPSSPPSPNSITPDRITLTLLWHFTSRHYSRHPTTHVLGPPPPSAHASPLLTPTEIYHLYTLPHLPHVLSQPHKISHERNLLKLLTLSFLSHGTPESLQTLKEIYRYFAKWGVVGDVVWLRGRVNRLRGMGTRRAQEGLVGRRDGEDGGVVVERKEGRALTEEEARRARQLEELVEVARQVLERQKGLQA